MKFWKKKDKEKHKVKRDRFDWLDTIADFILLPLELLVAIFKD